MPRARTGSAFPHGDHWDIQITLPNGERSKRACLDPSVTEAEARAEATRLTKIAAENGGALVKPATSLTVTPREERREMDRWFDAWIADRHAKGHTTTKEDRSRYEHHVERVFDGKHIRNWTHDDMRALSRSLDDRIRAGELSWKTARNVWATTGKMLADAVRSKRDELRCRASNPIRDVEAPDRGNDRARCYLYPSEVLRFVSCVDVPLHWRRAVAIGVYTFARAGELRVLDWSAIDLEHGTIHIHQARDRETGGAKTTKAGYARRFALEPPVLELLEAMHEENSAGAVLRLDSVRNGARGLQRWLRRAGVDRAELFADDETRQPIRFHDLRATGITWMAVRGDAPQSMMHRAGHTDFATTQLYVREAEILRDGFGEVFPRLPVDELRAKPSTLKRSTNRSGNRSNVVFLNSSGGADGTRSLDSREKTGEFVSQTCESNAEAHATNADTHATKTRTERIAELEAALVDATRIAGELSKTMRALSRELEELRAPKHEEVLARLEEEIAALTATTNAKRA